MPTERTITREKEKKFELSKEVTPSDGQPKGPRTKTDYVELAKERNARVILHNTPDTYPLTDLARYADQGLRRLRNRILISLAPEEALPLLNAYNEALITLHHIVAKICRITNVRYRTPRALVQVLGEDEVASKAADADGKPEQSGGKS
ncbi:MAG: hypothetical protein ACOZF0_12865 [Thermodesulfobacteriota bacterium]